MKNVEAFKRELQNYNYYCNMLSTLEEKLDETLYELSGVKAIRYDKAPSTPNMHLINEKKHYLSDKIEKIEKEISRLSIEVDYVEWVLSNMQDIYIRQAIIEVYINGKAILDICDDYNISGPGLHYQMNREIQKALQQIEGV